jgi:hypothetical protein
MEAEAVIDQPKRLERSVNRDASLAGLYRQEYAPMVRLAHLITGSNEVAEDVVQDAFVRMYRNWDRADQPGAYLRTIVVNGCRTWHRRRRWSASAYPGRVPQGSTPRCTSCWTPWPTWASGRGRRSFSGSTSTCPRRRWPRCWGAAPGRSSPWSIAAFVSWKR